MKYIFACKRARAQGKRGSAWARERSEETSSEQVQRARADVPRASFSKQNHRPDFFHGPDMSESHGKCLGAEERRWTPARSCCLYRVWSARLSRWEREPRTTTSRADSASPRRTLTWLRTRALQPRLRVVKRKTATRGRICTASWSEAPRWD